MRLDKKLADDATVTRIKSAFWAERLGASKDIQRYDNEALLFFDVRLPLPEMHPLFWSEK